MKKLTFAAVLIAALATLYFTNSANAEKASFGFSIPCQYCFSFTSMDGATSVSIEARSQASLNPYVVIGPYNNVTSAGNYTRTASEMQTQFGNGSFYARIRDNNNSSHVSQDEPFSIP